MNKQNLFLEIQKLFWSLTYFPTVGRKHILPRLSVHEVVKVTGCFKGLYHYCKFFCSYSITLVGSAH